MLSVIILSNVYLNSTVETSFSYMYAFNVFNKPVENGKVKINFSKNFASFYIYRYLQIGFFLIVKWCFVLQVIMPALFVLLAMVFAEIKPPEDKQPPLELQPWRYVPNKGEQHLYVFYR